MSSFFIDSYLNHSRSVCFLFILFCLVVCNKSCIVPAFLCGFFCFSREATHRACGVCAVCDDKDVDGNGDDEPHSQAIRHTHIYGNSSRSRVVNVKSHPSPVIYIPVDAVMFFLYARDSAVAFETCLDGKTATVKN